MIRWEPDFGMAFPKTIGERCNDAGPHRRAAIVLLACQRPSLSQCLLVKNKFIVCKNTDNRVNHTVNNGEGSSFAVFYSGLPGCSPTIVLRSPKPC